MWHDIVNIHVSFRWMAMTIPWVVICDPSHYWMVATIPWFHYDPFCWMVVPMPCIHLHDHSLDGCVHTTIHVLLFRAFSDVYVSMLACRFSNDGLWFPARTCKAFHSSLYFGLHVLGGIYYTTFYHCPCTPHPRSQSTSTVYLTCFPIMKKLPLCPSSWAKQFPFAAFPKNLLFTLV